jgi:hypothetical protein
MLESRSPGESSLLLNSKILGTLFVMSPQILNLISNNSSLGITNRVTFQVTPHLQKTVLPLKVHPLLMITLVSCIDYTYTSIQVNTNISFKKT